MKKKIMIGALGLVAATGLSLGQGLTSTTGNPQVEIPKQPAVAPPITSTATGGVIPTAVRNGNPLQMLNPGAPARYGNGHEHVTHDPADPGKPKGIKLFEWTF